MSSILDSILRVLAFMQCPGEEAGSCFFFFLLRKAFHLSDSHSKGLLIEGLVYSVLRSKTHIKSSFLDCVAHSYVELTGLFRTIFPVRSPHTLHQHGQLYGSSV